MPGVEPPVSGSNPPVVPARSLDQLSELALQKELALARGALARLRIRADIDTAKAWSVKAGHAAQAAAMVLTVASSIQALRRARQPVAFSQQTGVISTGTSRAWPQIVGLVGSVLGALLRQSRNGRAGSTARPSSGLASTPESRP